MPHSATQEQIHSAEQTAVNGLQPWTEKGLIGRGVLIDFMSYADRNGIQVSHFEGFAITLDQVLAIVAEQNVEIQPGDILLLRTGFTTVYKTLGNEQRKDVATRKEWCGLGQSRRTTEWLWKQQFAAVASDSPGFEVRRKSRFQTSFQRISNVDKLQHLLKRNGICIRSFWLAGARPSASSLTWTNWQSCARSISVGLSCSLQLH